MKTKEIIEEIIDDPLFFHGDRFFSEDPSIVGGIGEFNGRSVTFIGTHKGVGLDESVKTFFTGKVACIAGHTCPIQSGYVRSVVPRLTLHQCQRTTAIVL